MSLWATLALLSLIAISCISGVPITKTTTTTTTTTSYSEDENEALLEYLRNGPEVKANGEPDTVWLKICSGWTAQTMCSCVFGGGIPESVCWAQDIGYVFMPISEYTMDYNDRSATARCTVNNPSNQTYKAIHRPHLGCTLVEYFTEEEIRAIPVGNVAPPQPPLDPNTPFPYGNGFFPENSPDGVDLECIAAASQKQFDRVQTYNTRAITVVFQGYLVFEQYASQFNITKDTLLLGWSATKSITNAMISQSVKAGLLNIYDPAPVPEWNEVDDDNRSSITIDEMLRMTSGTYWPGDLPPSTECLYYSNQDCAHTSANHRLVSEPDTRWKYNSGSSYILSRISLDHRPNLPGNDNNEIVYNNYEYPRQAFFNLIRADSMYIEYQCNDVFLGGAYGYATARDWARFGLLYVRDGVWMVDGNRILPEGWMEYSSTSSLNPNYGAHFWKRPDFGDVFYAAGFRRNDVFIVPSLDLVITRNAMPPLAFHLIWNETEFLTDMFACFD